MLKKLLLTTLIVFIFVACNIGVSGYFESSTGTSQIKWLIYFGSDYEIAETNVGFSGNLERLIHIQKTSKDDFGNTIYLSKRAENIDIISTVLNNEACQATDNSYSMPVEKKVCDNSVCDTYNYYETVNADEIFPYNWPCDIGYNDLDYLSDSEANDLRNLGYYNVKCETGDFVKEGNYYMLSIVCSMEDSSYYYRRKNFYSNNLDYFDYFKPFP